MNARFNLYRRFKNSLRGRALVQAGSTKRPFKQSALRARRGVCLDAPRSPFSFNSARFRPPRPPIPGVVHVPRWSYTALFRFVSPHKKRLFKVFRPVQPNGPFTLFSVPCCGPVHPRSGRFKLLQHSEKNPVNLVNPVRSSAHLRMWFRVFQSFQVAPPVSAARAAACRQAPSVPPNPSQCRPQNRICALWSKKGRRKTPTGLVKINSA